MGLAWDGVDWRKAPRQMAPAESNLNQLKQKYRNEASITPISRTGGMDHDP